MNIRPATGADIGSIINLERQCASAAHWSEQQYQQNFQAGGNGPERIVLLVEGSFPASAPEASASSGVLGFLVAVHVAREWELENLVVAPSARREGLGKRLLDALLAAAQATDSLAVFLEVRESNVAARALYEKAGLEQIGRRRSYYSASREDAILYRLDLNPK